MAISKALIAVVIVISIGLVITMNILNDQNIEGKYINSDSDFNFYSDGTFVQDIHEKNRKPISLGGIYLVRGKEITIKFDLMGVSYHLRRVNSSVIASSEDGETWTNINDVPEQAPIPTPTPISSPPPLPVGIYYYQEDYLELKADGNYSMHENLPALTLENADNEGEYSATADRVILIVYGSGRKTSHLDRISYREFKIINRTTLIETGKTWVKK